jgi:hypothetical protein
VTDTLPADRQEALRRWNILRAQFGELVNQALTPEQQRLWMQLYGEPFPFDFNVFFEQSGTTQDFQSANVRSAAGGTQTPGVGPPVGQAGSGIGTSTNPTPGSGLGTSTNPTPGSGLGTAGSPIPGSGAGTSSGTGTSRTDRK